MEEMEELAQVKSTSHLDIPSCSKCMRLSAPKAWSSTALHSILELYTKSQNSSLLVIQEHDEQNLLFGAVSPTQLIEGTFVMAMSIGMSCMSTSSSKCRIYVILVRYMTHLGSSVNNLYLCQFELMHLLQGRVWSGKRGINNGLVDAIGGLPRALAIAKEAAGIDADKKVTLVEMSRYAEQAITLEYVYFLPYKVGKNRALFSFSLPQAV